MAPLLVIAAGGTGGHMFPAQSLAEAMLAEGWRVKLSTDDRGARYAGGFPQEVTREVVKAGTFARGGIASKLITPVRILLGTLAATLQMRRDRPTVVVGFGGYPAFPAMSAAWLLRLPRMIHEQNGVLGRVNALFASRVNTVACSVWPTELPSGANAVHTGNPVRGVVRARAGAAYTPPDGVLNVVMIGGSQGASILSQTVPAALAALPEDLKSRLKVAHQARPADHDDAVAAYAAAGIDADVRPFFDNVPELFDAAQLVISRAGASSIADITTIGRPSILIPLAIAIRDEQNANAKALAEADAAVVVQEAELAPDTLSGQIAAILGDRDRASKMAEAAQRLGRPDAVDRLKTEVMKLANFE